MAENYILLETIELSQTAASVTFDNIPQTGYTDLKVVISARNTTATTVGNVGFQMQVNGLTTGWTGQLLYASNTGTGSITRTNTALGTLNSANDTANTFSNAEVYIPNYTSSNVKSFSVESVTESNAAATELDLVSKLNTTTSPITSITFNCGFDSLSSGCTFSLYAIAATGTTPVTAPFATGGNIVANDGTYWYHAFLSSGTFTPLKTLSCDYLVIAGGGGGGNGAQAASNGGGGGAGGFRTATAQTLSATASAVTIGAGGAIKTNGGDSSFNSMVSSGGGAGGSDYTSFTVGANGGSGGGRTTAGAGAGTGNTPSTSPSQGNNGSNAAGIAPALGGGGGGGAGAAATTPNGGAGSSAYSSWGAATLTGQNVSGTYWYAGGGAAGTDDGTGVGGNGGGGAGSRGAVPIAATAGTASTGGGGAGGASQGVSIPGATGGSGIVIIRYSMV